MEHLEPLKGFLHEIDRDLSALDQGYGWACLDFVDEHWFWLWEELVG